MIGRVTTWAAVGALASAATLLPGLASSDRNPSAVVARVKGVEITAADLQSHIEQVRPSGYHPTTEGESRRLLDSLVRIRVLDLAAEDRGLEAGLEGRRDLLALLAAEHSSPVIRDSEIEAFLERHSFLAGETSADPGTPLRVEVERQILANKRRRQYRALTDQLVAATPVWVSPEPLAEWTWAETGRPDPRPLSPPLLPPSNWPGPAGEGRTHD